MENNEDSPVQQLQVFINCSLRRILAIPQGRFTTWDCEDCQTTKNWGTHSDRKMKLNRTNAEDTLNKGLVNIAEK